MPTKDHDSLLTEINTTAIGDRQNINGWFMPLKPNGCLLFKSIQLHTIKRSGFNHSKRLVT